MPPRAGGHDIWDSRVAHASHPPSRPAGGPARARAPLCICRVWRRPRRTRRGKGAARGLRRRADDDALADEGRDDGRLRSFAALPDVVRLRYGEPRAPEVER